MIQKEFTIQGRTKAITDDGNLYIKGIANTGQEDLEGDTVTKNALEQIVQQIPTHNLHMDHDKSFDGILGPLINGGITSEGVQFTARILDEKRELIESYLNQGVNLGASIAGQVEYDNSRSNEITEWKLTEISLTGIPADQGTMASVEIAKSFENVIEKIKQYGDENMADETYITQEDCIQLINDAFNEKQEELLEQIRKEIKDEYEVVITELKERLDSIETQITAPAEPTEGEPTEEEEGKAGDEQEEEETKAEETEEEEETKTEEEEEIDEKTLERALTKKLTQISKNIHYKYKAQQKTEEKNLHTPHELAKMALRK